MSVVHAYRWGWAPEGLATRRQLAKLGLTPGRAPVVGEIIWRRGRRVAYLYEIRTAVTKPEPTPGQLAALALAMLVRRTCTACGKDAGYCLPIRWGRRCIDCWDAHEAARAAIESGPVEAAELGRAA